MTYIPRNRFQLRSSKAALTFVQYSMCLAVMCVLAILIASAGIVDNTFIDGPHRYTIPVIFHEKLLRFSILCMVNGGHEIDDKTTKIE